MVNYTKTTNTFTTKPVLLNGVDSEVIIENQNTSTLRQDQSQINHQFWTLHETKITMSTEDEVVDKLSTVHCFAPKYTNSPEQRQ